jgi:outer membrane protein assembly factor BamB
MLVLAAGLAVGLATPRAWAQLEESSPVYIADATMAEEALGTVGALMARGGADEAVRLIQRVLEEQGDRMLATERPEVYQGVRERVHAVLLADPALLEAYRLRQNPRASALLDEGRWDRVARDWWLTGPGFEASLRRAQMLTESAAFAAGVRVLDDLLAHPDARVNASAAAGMAVVAASYDGSARAWEVADGWAALAGLPTPATALVQRPTVGSEGVISSLAWNADAPSGGASGGASLEGVVPRSLHRADLTEMDPTDAPEPLVRSGPARVELGWTLPTLAGAELFTNDGLTLTSFDRFTLRPRWRITEGSGVQDDGRTRSTRQRIGRIVEDSGSVTVEGDRVYAALGMPRTGSDESVGRVVSVDRATGRVVWSVLLGGLSEELRGAEPRGPLVLDGDVLVVGARKNLRSRRLVSLSLVGLDARTGAMLWSRTLGSAGSLPFQQLTQLSEGGVLREGVVYWTDKIGLVGAVETATGRVMWVRSTRAPGLYTRGARTPYATSLPVINGHGLFVLTPDQAELLQIDPASGELLASRVAEPVGQAAYLVAVGDRIASVGANRIAFYDPAGFADRQVSVTPELDERGLRGRAVAADGRLAAPVTAGVALIEPSGALRTEVVALDATGNIVVADGQAVVLDEVEAYSFLSWETASGMLEGRVLEGDFEAALALADLAQRSGREDRVLPAVDEAVRLAGRAADTGVARARVFEAVRQLADPDTRSGVIGTATRGALLERMGAVARTNEQRVTHALASGAWRTATGDVPGAAAAYQDVLLEPALARAIWSGGGLSVRAELEATRRLHALAERYGSRATGVSDQMARGEVEALGSGGPAEVWEGVARRYPASASGPLAWSRASAGWLREQRWASAERAARSGLRAAGLLRRRGQAPDRPVLDELIGTLMAALIAQSRPEEAGESLAEAVAQFGELSPSADGRAVAASAEPVVRRYPAIGPRIERAESPLLIAGSPVSPGVPAHPDLVLMHATQLGELAAYRAGSLARGHPEPLWRDAGVGAMPPVLAHADARALVLAWPDEIDTGRPARAEARDPQTGAVLWSTDLRFQIDRVDPGADPAVRLNGQIVSPLEGGVPNSHLVTVSDGRTLVMTDRMGRGVGVDLTDGAVLWQRLFGMTRVYGMDMSGGVLGLCGAAVHPPLARDADPFDAVLRGVGEAVDARTGETIQLIDDLGAETRWVRVAPDGQVLIGAGARVVALDTVAGRIDWSNADEELVGSMDAWVLGETLVVLGQDRVLWPISRREGVRQRSGLNLLGRGADRGWTALERRPFGLVAMGARGVTTHGPDGELLAADALNAPRAFSMTMLGERRAVLVDRGESDPDGETLVGVAIVDAQTGRTEDRVEVTLPQSVRRTPVQSALADGVVVVGFNEVSVVLTMPGGDG